MFHPASENDQEEFIELINLEDHEINLVGWKLEEGVQYTFPEVTLPARGFLVVAADVDTVRSKYPGLENVVGNWEGSLSNHSENIEIVDPSGNRIDRVQYADEGDWAIRQRGPLELNHRGWIWYSGADGNGKSLEWADPGLSNNYGQNWRSSIVDGGSPGMVNSVFAENSPPIIVNVKHTPIVPRSDQSIVMTAKIVNESMDGVEVTLNYREDAIPENQFLSLDMMDNGLTGDGKANDGVFTAVLAPQPNGTIIEFYVQAAEPSGLTRTWPAAAQQEDGSFAQTANALLQVDDQEHLEDKPHYRLIMLEKERAELEIINTLPPDNDGNLIPDNWSDAQMNGTLIGRDGVGEDVRYLVSIRNRGHGSRLRKPNNFRVNIPSDEPWHGQIALNLNSQYTYAQYLGSVLSRLSGVAAGNSIPVKLTINNQDRSVSGPLSKTYGYYVANEVLNSDFTDRLFTDDGNGNLYRGIRDAAPADLSYRGADPDNYRNSYFKRTNESQDDWQDLIELTRVLTETPDEQYEQEVRKIVNVKQWMNHIALMAIMDNRESGLNTGEGDDYYIYRGVEDPRFVLISYDLDSIMNLALDRTFKGTFIGVTEMPAFDRFLKWPEFSPLYYQSLQKLLDTVFSEENFSRVVNRTIGNFVPNSVVEGLLNWMDGRRDHIKRFMYESLSIRHNLDSADGYLYTNDASIAIGGFSDVFRTRRVLVNGEDAEWIGWQGIWSKNSVALNPGINRILVQALNNKGQAFDQQSLDVWRESESRREVSGVIESDATWTQENGPYFVNSDITILPGVTLTVEPGATVYMGEGTNVEVQGKILAVGNEFQRIRMTRRPGTQDRWNQIIFNNTREENRLAFIDFEFSGEEGRNIYAVEANVRIENCTWAQTDENVISAVNSSMLIQNCIFPDVRNGETINGNEIPSNGFFVVEANIFGKTVGDSDVIHFSGGERPGPIIQILDNSFSGGVGAALNCDGADAHVEGNEFIHFVQDNESSHAAKAIIGDKGAEVYISRNVFADNDYAVLLINEANAILHNNTFVRNSLGVVSFGEHMSDVEPGLSADMLGNIFSGNGPIRDYSEPADGNVTVSIDYSLFSEGFSGQGNHNIHNEDPSFIDPSSDYHLRSFSPAKGAGPNGLDMGYAVPPGVSFCNLPNNPTWKDQISINVWGPGVTHYKFRIDDGEWSEEVPVEIPIEANELASGLHRIAAIGKNSAGVWENATDASIFSWMIDNSSSGVRLNEILANNVSTVEIDGGYPDLIELFNDGPAPMDLGGMSITDDPSDPRKFVFSPGTLIEPEGFLTLIADSDLQSFGIHLGFGLDASGEGVYLYDNPDNNGTILDSVVFGPQIPDYSIGILDGLRWDLSIPTLGAANQRAWLSDPDDLRINEWLASSGDAFANDFVEIFNPNARPVSLGGMFLTDSPVGAPTRYQVPPLSFIDGFQHFVFLADGDPEGGPDHLPFKLSADQGMIGLFSSEMEKVDVIIYGPQTTGVSEGRSPSGADEIAFLAAPTPGSGPLDGGSIVINEIFANGNGGDGELGVDWVELYNPSNSGVDLSNYSLTDNLEQVRRWVFETGTIILPLDYRLVHFDSNSPVSSDNAGFGLSRNGETIYLFNAPESGTGLIDSVRFGIQPGGYSLGRTETDEWTLNTPTPLSRNETVDVSEPGRLRINEWMALPVSGPDWFEIYNPGDNPVDISGLYLTDDPAEIEKFQVEERSFIGAGESAFQLFIADSEPSNGSNHVNFKLSGDGESINMYTPSKDLVDFVTFEKQEDGASEGFYPDGSSVSVRFLTTPTPGAANQIDTDGDGMPDHWEATHGLNPDDPEDALLDPDGDGMSNLAEYRSGSDPNIAEGVIRFARVWNTGNEINLQFNIRSGEQLAIQFRGSVSEGEWADLQRVGPVTSSEEITVTDIIPDVSVRFYRIVLIQE